jgi:hypothetical protein
MTEQPDVDPDGTGLRGHASGDIAPEQSDSAITDDLPEAEEGPAAPDSSFEPESGGRNPVP